MTSAYLEESSRKGNANVGTHEFLLNGLLCASSKRRGDVPEPTCDSPPTPTSCGSPGVHLMGESPGLPGDLHRDR